jgi:hypothetical protein
MRGSSSPETPVWWEIPLDWPVEYVPCELEVVEPRPLTALEWAVLEVLATFDDALPSLEETAEELGLQEPKFLRDILRSLISLQALMTRPGVATPEQLDEVLFTERGRELFQKGQVDGEPVHQGHQLCFDVITDEALVPPTRAGAPKRAVIEESSLPAPRQELGLDLVRGLVERFGPSVGGADAHIRTVRVFEAGEATKLQAGHRWITHPLTLVPTPSGQLAVRTPSLSAAQRSWLLERPLSQWVDPSRCVTATWEEPPSFRRTQQPWAAWLEKVERLIPLASVVPEARRLISTARREVLIHAAWASAPGLEEALTAAASRGVAIYMPGGATTRVTAWSTAVQRSPGFILELACPGAVPGALVVDRSEALLLDEVRAEVEGSGRYTFEAAGWTRQRAVELCLELVETILTALPLAEVPPAPPLDILRAPAVDAVRRLLDEPRLQLDLARFALSPLPLAWERLEAWIASQLVSADRTAAIQHIAEMASRLAANATPAPWREAGATAWRALSTALLGAAPAAIPDEVLRALFRLTPPGVKLPETLDPFIERWVTPMPATQSPDALRLLSRLRALADERWQPGAALQCPRFHAAFERCLTVTAPAPDGQSLASLCRLVASVAPQERAKAWGEAVASLWPPPAQVQGFEAWRQRHQPLRDLLGSSLASRFIGAWRALIGATHARTAAQMVEQLCCVRDLLTAPEAIAELMAVPGSQRLTEKVDRLFQLREACRKVWEQNAPRDDVWSRYFQQLLTVSAKGYSAEIHDPLVRELTSQCQGWPVAESALRIWARQLAATLPVPTRPEAVPGWLSAQLVLAGAMGAEAVQSLSTEGIRRHQGALRDARARQMPLWAQTLEAWRSLGLDLASLEAVVNPPRPVETRGQAKKNKKGGKTR